MIIKVEHFLSKRKNRVGKAIIEFEPSDGILADFNLIGFSICENEKQELYVQFPASINEAEGNQPKSFYFLRPRNPKAIEELENKILDVYDKVRNFSNKIVI